MTDTVRPGCSVCHRPLPADRHRVCLPCIADTRHHLSQILDAVALVAVRALHGSPSSDGTGRSSGDVHHLPGGPLLAILGPSAATDADWMPEDGLTPLDVLGSWERLWREEWCHPAPGGPVTLSGCCGYLSARCEWAAESFDGYDDFAREVKELAATLTRTAGTDEQIDRGAPCLHCGGHLRRIWAEHPHRDWQKPAEEMELADSWSCRRCHRRYDRSEYAWAVGQVAAAERVRREREVVAARVKAHTDDSLVTRVDLAHHLPQLPLPTVRSWARRGHLPTHGSDAAGRTLYRLGDVRDLARAQQAGRPSVTAS